MNLLHDKSTRQTVLVAMTETARNLGDITRTGLAQRLKGRVTEYTVATYLTALRNEGLIDVIHEGSGGSEHLWTLTPLGWQASGKTPPIWVDA